MDQNLKRQLIPMIMKQSFTFVATCFLTIVANAQFIETFRADDDTATEEEIKKLEFHLASLLQIGDLETYSGFLTEDYIRINQNGIVSTKQEVLRPAASSSSFRMIPRDLNVRVYGNTAILNGTLDIEKTVNNTITKTSALFTKVFIRKDGKWYLASLQGTPLGK